jgi:hypothetical protein
MPKIKPSGMLARTPKISGCDGVAVGALALVRAFRGVLLGVLLARLVGLLRGYRVQLDKGFSRGSDSCVAIALGSSC